MAANKAGQSTREMARKRRKIGLTVLSVSLVLLIGLSFFINNSKALGIGGMGVLVLLVFLFFITDWTEDFDRRSTRMEKRATRGAVAEEEIGELLESLGEGFHVIHDVESPYGNIDHLVLSEQNGLFLIETKAHAGRVQVEGEVLLVNDKPPEKDFIAQVLKNTYWLREEIREALEVEAWITPILVFTNAFVPFGRPVKGVHIINKRFLLDTLQKPRKANPANQKLWAERETLAELLAEPIPA